MPQCGSVEFIINYEYFQIIFSQKKINTPLLTQCNNCFEISEFFLQRFFLRIHKHSFNTKIKVTGQWPLTEIYARAPEGFESTALTQHTPNYHFSLFYRILNSSGEILIGKIICTSDNRPCRPKSFLFLFCNSVKLFLKM